MIIQHYFHQLVVQIHLVCEITSRCSLTGEEMNKLTTIIKSDDSPTLISSAGFVQIHLLFEIPINI
jgi:hypothetical protein